MLNHKPFTNSAKVKPNYLYALRHVGDWSVIGKGDAPGRGHRIPFLGHRVLFTNDKVSQAPLTPDSELSSTVIYRVNKLLRIYK